MVPLSFCILEQLQNEYSGGSWLWLETYGGGSLGGMLNAELSPTRNRTTRRVTQLRAGVQRECSRSCRVVSSRLDVSSRRAEAASVSSRCSTGTLSSAATSGVVLCRGWRNQAVSRV